VAVDKVTLGALVAEETVVVLLVLVAIMELQTAAVAAEAEETLEAVDVPEGLV